MASKSKTILLCLIRCGQTTWDAEGRIHGATDLPLCDDGRVAVVADCIRLPTLAPGQIHTVYHPADDAALETAQIFARRVHAKTKSVADLADPNFGLLDGLTEGDFAERFSKRYKQWQGDPISLSPPEGENMRDARARIFAAAAKILRRSRSEEVAIALHDLGLGFLRCWLAERPPSDVWDMLQVRPRIERYALTREMIDRLQAAADEPVSTTA